MKKEANMNYFSSSADGLEAQDLKSLKRLQDAHKFCNPVTRGDSSVEVKSLCKQLTTHKSKFSNSQFWTRVNLGHLCVGKAADF